MNRFKEDEVVQENQAPAQGALPDLLIPRFEEPGRDVERMRRWRSG